MSMKKSQLNNDLDALVLNMKLARQMIDELPMLCSRISDTTAIIEHAARQGMFLGCVPQELKDRLSKQIDSMHRCRELLNQAEPASRGLAARHLLEELYRELP
jgi:hypothetical protein